jgi:hypothetical protein
MEADKISTYILNNKRVENNEIPKEELCEMLNNDMVDLYKVCKYQKMTIEFMTENKIFNLIKTYNVREEHDISIESFCGWQNIDINDICKSHVDLFE